MRKIPTLFIREFEAGKPVKVTDRVCPGMEWVLEGKGVATVKVDGACCTILNGVLYKRYDAKRGRKVPEDAIPCQPEADPVTGHFPCWRPCRRENPEDKWFWAAYDNTDARVKLEEWTYEAVGPHFRANPYHLEEDMLVKHGTEVVDIPRTFEGIRDYLENHCIEGIVFWRDNEPGCKIKRSDFGFKWPA